MTPLVLKQILIDAIQENLYIGNAIIIDDIVNNAIIIKSNDYEITLSYTIERK